MRSAVAKHLHPLLGRRMVDWVVEAARPLADASGHTLTLERPANPILLSADVVRLAQVFGNLLNNAAGGAVGFAGSTFLAGLLKSKLPLPAAVPPQVAQAVLAAVVGFGLDMGLKKFAPKMRTAAQVGSALAVVAPLARQFNVPGFAGLGADDLTEADLALLDIPLQGLGAGNWGYPLLGAPDLTFVADPVTAADTWSDQVAAFSQAFNY